MNSAPDPIPEEKAAQPAEEEPSSDKTLPAEGKDVKSPGDEEEAKDKVGPMPSSEKGSKGKQEFHIRVADPSGFMASESGGSGPESDLVEEDYPQDELITQHVEEVGTTEDELAATGTHSKEIPSDLDPGHEPAASEPLSSVLDQAEQPDALDIHAPAPEMPSGGHSGSHESGNQETHVLQSIESVQPITGSSGLDSLGHGGVLVDAASSEPGSDRHQQPSLAASSQDLTTTKDESEATDPLTKDISHSGAIPSNTVTDDPSANVAMASDMIQVQGSATPVNQDTTEVVGREELPETVDQNTSGPKLHDKDISSPLQDSFTHQLVPEETTMAQPEAQQDQSLAAQDSEISQIPDTAAVTDAELAIPDLDSRHGQDQEHSEVLEQDSTPRDLDQSAAPSTEQVISLDQAMSIENSLDDESSPTNTASAPEQNQHHHAAITDSIEPEESQSAREIPVSNSDVISDAVLEPTASYQAPDVANADAHQDAEKPKSAELLETLPPLEEQQAQVNEPVEQSDIVPETSEELSSHDLAQPQLTEPVASIEPVSHEPVESSVPESLSAQDQLLVESEAPESKEVETSALIQPVHDEVADEGRPIDIAHVQDVPQDSLPTSTAHQLETGSFAAEETQKDPVGEELPVLPDEPQAQHHVSETNPELTESHVDVPEESLHGNLEPSTEANLISTQEPQVDVEDTIAPTVAPEARAEDESADVEHDIDNTSLAPPDLPAADQLVTSTMDSEHAIKAEPIGKSVDRQELAPVSETVPEFPEAVMRDLDVPKVEDHLVSEPVAEKTEATASAEEPESLISTIEDSDTGVRGDSVPAGPNLEHVEITQDSPPVVETDDQVLSDSHVSSPPDAVISSEKLTEDVAPGNSELNRSESFTQEQSDPQATLLEPIAPQESPSLVQETVQPQAGEDTALPETTAGSEVDAGDSSPIKSDLDHTMAEPSVTLPQEDIHSSMSHEQPVDRDLLVESEPKPSLEPQEAPGATPKSIDEPSEPVQSAAVHAQEEPLPGETEDAMTSTTETPETVLVGDHAIQESVTAQPEDPLTERSPDVSHADEVSTDLAEAPENQAALEMVQEEEEVLRDGNQAPTSLPQEVESEAPKEDLPEQSSAELHEENVDLQPSVERDEPEAVGADVQTTDALGGSQQLATENVENSGSVKDSLPETDERGNVAFSSETVDANSQDHSVEANAEPRDSLPDSSEKAPADDLSAEEPQSAVVEEGQALQEPEIDTSEQDSTQPKTEEDQTTEHQGLTAGIAAGAAAITAGAGALASQLFTSRHAEPSKDEIPRQLRELPQPEDAPLVPLKSPARSLSSESSREDENYTLDDHSALEHHSTLHEAAVPRSAGQTSMMSQLPPKAALKEHRPDNAASPPPPELPTNHNQTVLEGTTRDSLTRPILDHSGTQTGRDSASRLPAQPSHGNIDGPMSMRSLTPGIVLPDLSDPTAKALGRARSLRRSRRRTIRMNEETVAAAVIIYATASNMSSSSYSRLGSAQIEANISRSRDLGTGLEAGVQGVELTDVYNSVTDNLSTDDEDKNSSERRRRRRHSRSSEAKPAEIKEETRQKRRVSIASSKSDTSNLVPPSRTDSGLSESSRSTRPRRHRTAEEQAAHEARKQQRTPEEQADHDRRKAERRARHEKEREREVAKGKDPETPQSRRHSHHSHGSSKRDSTQSASSTRPDRTPRSVDTPSTPPKKSFFSFKSAESAVTPGIVSRASEPSVPRASKEAPRPENARRSHTTREAPTRKAPDVPKPEEDASKPRERERRSPRDRDHSHHHRPHRPRERSPDKPKPASGTAKEVEDSSPANGADAEKPRERRPAREHRERREHREDKRERNYRREERQRTRDMEAKKQAAPAATTGFKGIFKKIFA